jgi:alkylated DNA nucleotide flippase Atl1
MNHAEQAQLVWPVLALAAQMQRVLTYGEVQDFTGIGAKYQGEALNRIKAYCERKHYPLLNSIVVLADTRLPGGSPKKMTADEIVVEQARVFDFGWVGKNPHSEDFEVSQSVTA